jgi:uncharacterized protein
MKPQDWRRTRLGEYLRHIPRPKHLRGSWIHRRLGDSMFDPALWHPEKRKVAGGFALGAFFSMIPMPFQTLPTLILGYFTRVNLPAALLGVWISNPLTTAPLIYLQYKLGHWILSRPEEKALEGDFSWVELLKEAPLAILAGAMVTAVIAALLAYPLVLLVWDLLHRWVLRSKARRMERQRKSQGVG